MELQQLTNKRKSLKQDISYIDELDMQEQLKKKRSNEYHIDWVPI